jgi:hypothetical protein
VRQIQLETGEKGRNVTVLLSMNAADEQFITPLFVFTRMRLFNEMKRDAPEGSFI